MARLSTPHPLAWLRDRPFETDCLAAAALIAVTVPGLWFVDHRETGAGNWRHPDALAVIIVLCEIVPLAWRRRWPDRVLVSVGLATIAFYASGYAPSTGALPVLLAFFTLAVYRTRERMIWPALFTLSGVLASLGFYRGKIGVGSVVGNLAIFAAAWFIGDNVRNRRARTTALVERAERLEREREANARQAVTEERARIARELHDVVAHSMSVMVVQAGAARRVIDQSPLDAKEALLSIEETGRQALDEMRRLLGVFRRDEPSDAAPDRSPQPSVSELDSLLDHIREAGLEVSLDVEGEPRPLLSGVDLSAYRVIQEALTNCLKHAGPARARVVLRWTAGRLELEVTDDGRGLAAQSAADGASGGGHGLVGMRERVSLYGGDLQAGPAPDGGFRIRARFPLETRSAAGRS